MNTQALLLFLAGSIFPSFLVALFATYLVRRHAVRFGLIDLPGERKVHTTPMPRGGGLAIWVGVVGTFAAAQLFVLSAQHNSTAAGLIPDFARGHLAGIAEQSPKLWILLAAGTALTLLGLLDDRGGLSWQVRLLVEFAVAALCVWLVPNLRLTAFLPFPPQS